ncbi:protease inhibitor I9 family protein [Streptomyces sp. NPDC006463]|uniref:protease inhibitor I9 family protein n=1 Tax=Streptomyces sp. NPDC006463 TaxID=3364746 RepID=UPI0036C8BD78
MRNRLNRALPTAAAVAAVLAAVAALPVSAATAAVAEPVPRTAAAAAADHATYIVTVHPGLDPAAVADAYGITPLHVYRDALNGFAARLSPEQVQALRATAVVKSVEEDGGASSFGTAV